VEEGDLARTSAGVRLASHADAIDERDPAVQRLLAELDGPDATQPPTIAELVAGGIPRDVIEASARSGLAVRVSPELVFSPEVIDRARGVVADAGAAGITVSAFRAALGTSRKYALPLLEWFDQRGITRRQGDLRFARS
jgi:selenocysteine-specific elongation factor